jgi:hypothetical protein
MIKLRDQAQNQKSRSVENASATKAEANWESLPLWLRYAEPQDQPEGTPSNDEPVWLRWRDSGDKSASSGLRTESTYSATAENAFESDSLAYSLRHQLWEGESAADSLNPDAVQSTQTIAPANNSSRGHKNRLVIVAACVFGAIALAFAVGLLGLVNNRFFAKPTLASFKLAATWPATWTPTPTTTPTQASTPTRTVAATVTRTALPSRVPPTWTPRPLATLAPTVNPYLYIVYQRSCQHSGGTFIEGRVNSLIGEVYGAHVTLGSSPGGDVIQTLITGTDRSPGYYSFIISAIGPRQGIFYVWITDTAGKPLSDPSAGRVITNAIQNSDDPASCWQASVDFVATR